MAVSEEMTRLYCEHNEDVIVWSVQDIASLRSKYRIVGKLIGSSASSARQNQVMTRPMYLNKCETTLLIEKEFACLVRTPRCELSLSTIRRRQEITKSHHKESLEIQRVLAKEAKIADITLRADKIVTGVLKKKEKSTCTEEERNEIISNVTKEIKPIQEEQMLVQQPIESLWDDEAIAVDWRFPHTDTQKYKYIVFRDLWQQGFMMSCGAKFGGDFLVYPGDPELYHAKFVTVCQQSTEPLTPTDVVQVARLASNVKKTALMCHVDPETERVTYTKLDYNPG